MYGFIYITINLINNKKYIGKCSYLKNNWEHYLGSGLHLTRAIKKYGKENFKREIIEICESKDILNKKEKYWISYYNATINDEFYNIADGGDGGNVISGYNNEQKMNLSNKLSKMRKGIVNLGNKNGSATKVICLNTMEVFDTIVEASVKYGISKDSIQQCCSDKSKLKTAGICPLTGEKMIWQYYEEGKDYTYLPYKKKIGQFGKQVYCITTDEIFNSVCEAGKKYNISPSSISECCNNKLKSAGKNPVNNKRMIWVYYKDFLLNEDLVKEKLNHSTIIHPKPRSKKVKCVNTQIIFDSLKDASQWCGMKIESNISEVCNKNRKSAGKHPETNEKLIWSWVEQDNL